MNYAFHIDASLYAKFLRKFSEGFGVQRIEGKIVEVKTDPTSGYITAIRLDSGADIEGDLFIDCTGFRGLLIGQALDVELRGLVALAATTTAPWRCRPNPSATPCRTRARSRARRAGNGAFRCSTASATAWSTAAAIFADEQAKQTLLANVEGKVLTEPRVIKFRPGQRREHWKKNCIAVGLASGFIEPLESTSIHLIQRSIIRLMQMFPRTAIQQSDVDEFNQQMRTEIEHIRDFIILHYHVTDRQDTPFWRAVRNMEHSGVAAAPHRPVPRDRPRVPRAERAVRRELLDPGHAGPGHHAAAAPSGRRPDGR